MNKKEYTKPEFEVIESSSSPILAGSTEMLEKGVKGDPDESERDGYGWITIE